MIRIKYSKSKTVYIMHSVTFSVLTFKDFESQIMQRLVIRGIQILGETYKLS